MKIYMQRLVLIVYLLLSLLTAWGCSPKEGDLNGEVFIVTKGRTNIRLALVEVRAFTEKQFSDFIESKKKIIEEKTQQIDLELQELKNKIDGTDKKGGAPQSAIYGKIQNIGAYGYTDENGTYHFTNQLPEGKEYRTIISDRTRSEKVPDKVESQAMKKKRQLRQQYDALILERKKLVGGSYFFNDVPDGVANVKTDADGKFTMRLNRKSKYALIAFTERKVIDETEKYYWIVWVSLDGKESKKLC